MSEIIDLDWYRWQRDAEAVEKKLRHLNRLLDQVEQKQIWWINYLQQAGAPLTDEMRQCLERN